MSGSTSEWEITRTTTRHDGKRYQLSIGVTVVWSEKHRRYACLTCKLPEPCAHTRYVQRVVDAHETEAAGPPALDDDDDAPPVFLEPSPAAMQQLDALQTQLDAVRDRVRADVHDPYDPATAPGLWGPDSVYRLRADGTLRKMTDDEARDVKHDWYKDKGRAQRQSQDARMQDPDHPAAIEQSSRDALLDDAPTYREDD